MNSEQNAWFFLNRVPYMGPMRFHELMRVAGSATEILNLPVSGLMSCGVPEDMAQMWWKLFRDENHRRAFENECVRIKRGEFQAIAELDAVYPEVLRELDDRPPVLYVKGIWPLPPSVLLGIVGTRRPSSYGICVAERFTTDFVKKGIVTVSGLATGIDTIVHRATLREKGHTVAVLGHGFQYLFPRENKRLFEEIAEKGTLLTEFPFETRPDARHFPRRNRIISGLSRGVCVVEAGEKSGACITARYAAEQGRDVFVVPGGIFSSQSHGCHRLIKEGARLVETAQEILEEYFLSSPSVSIEDPSLMSNTTMDSRFRGNDSGLTPLEKKLLTSLSSIPLSVDELVEMSGTPVDRLAEVLLSLELKGRIQALPGQRYVTQI